MDKLPAGAQLQQDKDDDNKRAQEEQMRRDLLATVLDTAARERCASGLYFQRTQYNIWSIVKYPGSLSSAQSGQSRSKPSLFEWLSQVNWEGGWPKHSSLVFSIKYVVRSFQRHGLVKLSL